MGTPEHSGALPMGSQTLESLTNASVPTDAETTVALDAASSSSHAYEVMDAYTLRATPGVDYPEGLALTTPWSPSTCTLESYSDDNILFGLRLRVSPPYSPANHRSFGLGKGLSMLGMCYREKGRWYTHVMKMKGDPTEESWSALDVEAGGTLEVSDGRAYQYQLWCPKTKAAHIQAFENEHVEDFDYAWQQTIGLVDRKAPLASGITEEDALGELVDQLQEIEATHAIPQYPDRIGYWGPHLQRTYLAFCGQSSRRDLDLKTHRPKAKRHSVRKLEDGSYALVAEHELWPLGPPSAALMDASQLPQLYTADSWPEYLVQQSDVTRRLTRGTHVRLAKGLTSEYTTLYEQPRLMARHQDGGHELVNSFEAGGGTVQSVEGYWVWVLVVMPGTVVRYARIPEEYLTVVS